jgi:hypothetical protein
VSGTGTTGRKGVMGGAVSIYDATVTVLRESGALGALGISP